MLVLRSKLAVIAVALITGLALGTGDDPRGRLTTLQLQPGRLGQAGGVRSDLVRFKIKDKLCLPVIMQVTGK